MHYALYNTTNFFVPKWKLRGSIQSRPLRHHSGGTNGMMSILVHVVECMIRQMEWTQTAYSNESHSMTAEIWVLYVVRRVFLLLYPLHLDKTSRSSERLKAIVEIHKGSCFLLEIPKSSEYTVPVLSNQEQPSTIPRHSGVTYTTG